MEIFMNAYIKSSLLVAALLLSDAVIATPDFLSAVDLSCLQYGLIHRITFHYAAIVPGL
jgi:hypothetical protein